MLRKKCSLLLVVGNQWFVLGYVALFLCLLCVFLGMGNIEWFVIKKPREEGKIEKIEVGGKKLCVILIDGQVYVTSSRCPHAGADLSKGWCEGKKLVCPYHRHRFDLQSGKGDAGQNNYIDVYPIKEENNQWYVGMKKPWWRRL